MKLSTLILLSSAITYVSSQSPCFMLGYQQCLETNDMYKSTTCDPIQKYDFKLFQQCQCFSLANRVLCYEQCPSNSTIMSERNSVTVPSRNSICSASGLDPNTVLSLRGAWATWTVPGTGSPTAATTGSQSTGKKDVNGGDSTGSNTSSGVANFAKNIFAITAAVIVGFIFA